MNSLRIAEIDNEINSLEQSKMLAPIFIFIPCFFVIFGILFAMIGIKITNMQIKELQEERARLLLLI